MRFGKFIIILPFLWWAFNVRAQEQWQTSLDVIKSKAQALMVEHNGLQVEYRQLTGQVQQLQQSIYAQQNKNDRMELFLKERHGRTDQQLQIEELTQSIKTKRQKALDLDQQLENLKKKQLNLDKKVSEAQRPQNTLQPKVDDQLGQWRKQLEDESKQEVILENELNGLKAGDKTQYLNKDDRMAGDNARRYDQLKRRKDRLEAEIRDYESRLDGLREISQKTLPWTLKRKQLVHEMVQTDARNNKMRDKIKVLREDIDVLKDQVARLERRVDFVNGQVPK